MAYCIADLEDSVGWNDATAFPVLAKVSSFFGLQVEAGVALSLQFSMVDNYDNSNSNSSHNSTKSDVVVENGLKNGCQEGTTNVIATFEEDVRDFSSPSHITSSPTVINEPFDHPVVNDEDMGVLKLNHASSNSKDLLPRLQQLSTMQQVVQQSRSPTHVEEGAEEKNQQERGEKKKEMTIASMRELYVTVPATHLQPPTGNPTINPSTTASNVATSIFATDATMSLNFKILYIK